jgi:hypothetical protein
MYGPGHLYTCVYMRCRCGNSSRTCTIQTVICGVCVWFGYPIFEHRQSSWPSSPYAAQVCFQQRAISNHIHCFCIYIAFVSAKVQCMTHAFCPRPGRRHHWTRTDVQHNATFAAQSLLRNSWEINVPQKVTVTVTYLRTIAAQSLLSNTRTSKSVCDCDVFQMPVAHQSRAAASNLEVQFVCTQSIV